MTPRRRPTTRARSSSFRDPPPTFHGLPWQVDDARSQQLSLQALYPRPPPAWLHPAFGAEFGDSFIGGTSLESSALHVSLDVFLLVLNNLVGARGVGSELPHGARQALSRATALLKDCRTLAFKLVHAMSGARAASPSDPVASGLAIGPAVGLVIGPVISLSRRKMIPEYLPSLIPDAEAIC